MTEGDDSIVVMHHQCDLAPPAQRCCRGLPLNRLGRRFPSADVDENTHLDENRIVEWVQSHRLAPRCELPVAAKLIFFCHFPLAARIFRLGTPLAVFPASWDYDRGTRKRYPLPWFLGLLGIRSLAVWLGHLLRSTALVRSPRERSRLGEKR
jgi:hypothetical protein